MKHSLKIKIITTFLLLAIIPIIILGTFSYKNSLYLGKITLDSVKMIGSKSIENLKVLGEKNLNDSIDALDEKSSESHQLRSVETAKQIADFLYERDADIKSAALLDAKPESYLKFYNQHQRSIIIPSAYKVGEKRKYNWNKDKKTATNPLNQRGYKYYDAAGFKKKTIPLYYEMTFYDLSGQEKIKIRKGRIVKDLKNIKYKKNTYLKSETYKKLTYTEKEVSSDFYFNLKNKSIQTLIKELGIKEGLKWKVKDYHFAKNKAGNLIEKTYYAKSKKLKKGDIYVSRMIGGYVKTHIIGPYSKERISKAGKEYEPQNSAYAGKENPEGIEFEGIIRWVTPIYRGNKKIGYVSLALDHKHIMEFTDHLTPTEERYTDISDPGSGNYAFLWDDAHRCISHARDYFIMGYDPLTGKEVPAWAPSTWVQQIKAGTIGLDGKSLKEKAIQCEGWINATEKGGSGSFLIFWSGLWKFTAVATVPYYTGDYGNHKRGFGYVTIGAEIADFHKAANITGENIKKNIDKFNEALDKSSLETKSKVKRINNNNIALIIIISIILGGVVTILGIIFSNKIINPVKYLIKGTEEIKSGHYDFNIDIEKFSHDEIGTLATNFNLMANSLLKNKNEIEDYSKNLEKKVEERTSELEKAYDDLKEMDKLRTHFFANISHELRTPLTLSIAPLESVMQQEYGKINEEQNRFLKIIHNNSMKLLNLINNLLDLSKVEAGKSKVSIYKTNIVPQIERLVEPTKITAEKRNIKVNYIRPIDELFLYLDVEKFEKIIMNLLSNALKFTGEEGSIEIKIEDSDKQVSISVADTGIGIKENDLPHIFERFRQVDGSSNREYEGTGIGLSLVKEFTELLHGEIKVTSDYGKGTTFTMIFPKGKEHFTKETNIFEQEYSPEDMTMNKADIQFAGLDSEKDETINNEVVKDDSLQTVMIVDDNPDIVNYVSSLLVKKYNLLAAFNGQQALEIIKKQKPDLVISDIMMPKMNGYELLTKIKNNPETSDIIVVMLSAKAEMSEKIEGLETGADEYIIKPFNSRELLARVKSLLALRKFEHDLIQEKNEKEKIVEISKAKVDGLNEMITSISHEMNTPVLALNFGMKQITKYISELQREDNVINTDEHTLMEEKYQLSLESVTKSIESINKQIENMKSFVKFQQDVSDFNLNDEINTTLNVISFLHLEKLQISKDFSDKLPQIAGDAANLNQILTNLIRNAIESIPEEREGKVDIKTIQDNNNVIATIKDNGCGIKEEHKDNILNKRFTTKKDGKGIGLMICKEIAAANNWKIEFSSKENKGTSIDIIMPIIEDKKGKEDV
jgi:hypothetical protein